MPAARGRGTGTVCVYDIKTGLRIGYRNLTGAVPVVTIRSEELLDRLERAPLWSERNEDRRAFEDAHPSLS